MLHGDNKVYVRPLPCSWRADMEVHPQTGQTALPSHSDQAKTLTGEIPQAQKEVDKQVMQLEVAAFLRSLVLIGVLNPYCDFFSVAVVHEADVPRCVHACIV